MQATPLSLIHPPSTPQLEPPRIAPAQQGRLAAKVALIIGGESGIGRAVAVSFAREGADIAIVSLEAHEEAIETCRAIQAQGRSSILITGDIGCESFAATAVEETVRKLGRLDVVVNNIAEQHPMGDLLTLSTQQVEKVIQLNLLSCLHFAKAAVPHLPAGGSIIHTTSVETGSGCDFHASRGTLIAFTRSMARSLSRKRIRVNAVAPGSRAFTTPASEQRVSTSPGTLEEIIPSYLFLASNESGFFTGQVLHPNGSAIP